MKTSSIFCRLPIISCCSTLKIEPYRTARQVVQKLFTMAVMLIVANTFGQSTNKQASLTSAQKAALIFYQPSLVNASNQIAVIDKKIDPLKKRREQIRALAKAAPTMKERVDMGNSPEMKTIKSKLDDLDKQKREIQFKIVQMKQKIENAK